MEPCPKCGQVHTACSKHRQTDGQPCRKAPIDGHDACTKHAGKSTEVVKQEVSRRRALAALNLDGDANPLDELLMEVQRAAAAVRWLGEKVAAMNDLDVINVREQEIVYADGKVTTTYTGSVNGYVKMWQAERDRLARVCKITLEAGVDERRVRLAETQGALIVDVLKATLDELGIVQDDRVREILSRHLRSVA